MQPVKHSDTTTLLNTLAEGAGDPVILVHGMAASNQHWHFLLHDLAQAGFRGYAPDLPGHGDSPKPEEPARYSAQAVYTVFERWLENLAVDKPVRLVGHSLGGFLSLLYTSHHPERVASLVLIDPYINQSQLRLYIQLSNRIPALTSKFFPYLPRWFVHLIFDLDPTETNHFPRQIRHEIAADYLRASPNIIYLGASVWDLTSLLPQIQSPTLLVWGDHDRTLKPTSFPRMALQMPHSEVFPVAGSGHQPHIEQSHKVNQRVVDFFRRG